MAPSRRLAAASRRLLVVSLLVLAIVGLTGLVVFSPLALGGLGGLAGDWDRLSLIGQTYGAASALLSVIALTGVGASLILQSRENRANREQALRTSHAELMRLAMDDPAYAEIWAPLNPPGSFEVQRQHMYVNLVVSHWEMEYGLGALTDRHLRVIARAVLSTPAGQRYWQVARPVRVTSSVGRHERRFNKILEEEYRNSAPGTTGRHHAPVPGNNRPCSGAEGNTLARFALFAVLLAAVAAVTCRLCSCARRLRQTRQGGKTS